MNKLFRVAAVSSNTNSFGLRGYVLLARDGEAWEVAHSDYPRWSKGADLAFPVGSFPGCEIPRRLPKAPAKIVKEIFA